MTVLGSNRSTDAAAPGGPTAALGAALGATAALALTGGLSGPLAPLALLPFAACALAGTSWRDGLALSALAALLAGGLQLLGWVLPPAEGGARAWLALGAVCLAAAPIAVAWRHETETRRRREEEEADNAAALSTALEGHDDVIVLLDRSDRPLIVYGGGDTGLAADLARSGLSGAAEEADQATLRDALSLARRHGAAQARFRLRSAPRALFLADFRRGGRAGMAVAIRPDAAGAPRLAPTGGALDEGALLARVRELQTELAATRGREAELAGRLETAEARLSAVEAEAGRSRELAESRSRFLANMSHELRTPLNAILGFSDVMRERMFGELTPKYAEYAELIHASGAHLLDLVNDVLDVSKMEANRYVLKLETFDLREPVGDALKFMRPAADEAKVHLRGALPSGAVEVRADRRAVRQIALNLLSNAVKFTPEGGHVLLSVGGAGDAVEIIVADTGVGIAPDDIQRLGRPFEQAGAPEQRAQGSGLGLSLVSALAAQHGGAVAIESRLGGGTAVTVRLPILAAAPLADETASVREAPGEDGADTTPPISSGAP